MKITEVREALNDALDSIGGVVVYKTAMTNPTQFPCMMVGPAPESMDYRVAKDTDRAVFNVWLFIGYNDQRAQEVLEAVMSTDGTDSLLATLYADRSLGGVVSNLRLLSSTSGTYSVVNGIDNIIGCEFRVEVLG